MARTKANTEVSQGIDALIEQLQAIKAMATIADSNPRGPLPGYGRGPGKAWAGIVEKTEDLPVRWVVELCQAFKVDPCGLVVTWYDQPLTIERIGSGRGRHLWACPCGQKVDRVFHLVGRVACRHCHRLGYQSQARRQDSLQGALDVFFANHGDEIPDRLIGHSLIKDLQAAAQSQVKSELAAQLYDLLTRLDIGEQKTPAVAP